MKKNNTQIMGVVFLVMNVLYQNKHFNFHIVHYDNMI